MRENNANPESGVHVREMYSLDTHELGILNTHIRSPIQALNLFYLKLSLTAILCVYELVDFVN